MSQIHRLSRAIPLWILAAVLASDPAIARLAAPDQTFLDDQIGQLEGLQDSLLTRGESPPVILDGVRRVLLLRLDALAQRAQRRRIAFYRIQKCRCISYVKRIPILKHIRFLMPLAIHFVHPIPMPCAHVETKGRLFTNHSN